MAKSSETLHGEWMGYIQYMCSDGKTGYLTMFMPKRKRGGEKEGKEGGWK
jgi:hypothetical protein